MAGVDLDVMPGEVIGIVGESGCGKSTLGRIVSGILPPSAGELRYRGKPVQGLPGPERRAYELGVQMIFQDPYASLNPRMRVREIIGEAPVAHKLVAARDKADYVAGLMRQVGLDPATRSVIRTSSRAASASASASRARWRSSPPSSSATRRWRRWTCRSRRRC